MRCLAPVIALFTLMGCAAALHAADAHRFTYRPAKVGEVSQHLVNLKMDLAVAVKKDGRLLESSQRQLQRKQQRKTVVLEASAHGPSKVKVTYQLAEKEATAGGQTVESAAQVVSGKTYTVARVGEQLVVTDEHGETPDADELAIVTHDLESLGRPNLIGQFLHDKSFAVGQKIELPNELAKELLGFTDTVGEVTRFELTFSGVKKMAGVACAVLTTDFEARSNHEGTMSMKIRGQLLLDLASCHAVVVQLSGPVSRSEQAGVGAGEFTLDTNGTLSLTAQSSRTIRK